MSDEQTTEAAQAVSEVYAIERLMDTGLLWYVNRVAFHPRGFSLGLHSVDGVVTGFQLTATDGTELFSFDPEAEDDFFRRVEAFLGEVRTKANMAETGDDSEDADADEEPGVPV